jgi:hypothetical protein
MLKILKEKWNKNENLLKEKINNMTPREFYELNYKDIVKLTFETIFNDSDDYYDNLNMKQMTEIDDGDYQGTLLYLIPFKTYPPSESEYLMTYVGYGSCSGCDTLLSIQDYDYGYDKPITENQKSELLQLCRDIIVNTIKPYNYGWRNDGKFDVIEEE